MGSFPVKKQYVLKRKIKKKGTIITIMPGVPWWGQFHVIASPNMGSLPVKGVSIQKKGKKKGHDHYDCAQRTFVGMVPCHHEPERGQFSCK